MDDAQGYAPRSLVVELVDRVAQIERAASSREALQHWEILAGLELKTANMRVEVKNLSKMSLCMREDLDTLLPTVTNQVNTMLQTAAKEVDAQLNQALTEELGTMRQTFAKELGTMRQQFSEEIEAMRQTLSQLNEVAQDALEQLTPRKGLTEDCVDVVAQDALEQLTPRNGPTEDCVDIQDVSIMRPPTPISTSLTRLMMRHRESEEREEIHMMATEDNSDGPSPRNSTHRAMFIGDFVEDYFFPEQQAGYTQLEQDMDHFDSMIKDGKCSEKNMKWALEWLNLSEAGELDIYTCLCLSNACTCTRDTRNILFKVLTVIALQCFVPCILLYIQSVKGINPHPKHGAVVFRIVGVCLYAYAVSSVHRNASDSCRTQLLQFMLANKAKAGELWPLIMGELLNVFVSFILVVTLFVVFTEADDPIELILNAVAVNFLGAVDAELVDSEMMMEAHRKFRVMFLEYGCDARDEWRTCVQGKSSLSGLVLNICLIMMDLAGVFLTCVFAFNTKET